MQPEVAVLTIQLSLCEVVFADSSQYLGRYFLFSHLYYVILGLFKILDSSAKLLDKIVLKNLISL